MEVEGSNDILEESYLLENKCNKRSLSDSGFVTCIKTDGVVSGGTTRLITNYTKIHPLKWQETYWEPLVPSR